MQNGDKINKIKDYLCFLYSLQFVSPKSILWPQLWFWTLQNVIIAMLYELIEIWNIKEPFEDERLISISKKFFLKPICPKRGEPFDKNKHISAGIVPGICIKYHIKEGSIWSVQKLGWLYNNEIIQKAFVIIGK